MKSTMKHFVLSVVVAACAFLAACHQYEEVNDVPPNKFLSDALKRNFPDDVKYLSSMQVEWVSLAMPTKKLLTTLGDSVGEATDVKNLPSSERVFSYRMAGETYIYAFLVDTAGGQVCPLLAQVHGACSSDGVAPFTLTLQGKKGSEVVGLGSLADQNNKSVDDVTKDVHAVLGVYFEMNDAEYREQERVRKNRLSWATPAPAATAAPAPSSSQWGSFTAGGSGGTGTGR